MKRALLIGLVLLVLIPAGLLLWLSNTESGLRWAYRSAMPALPAGLSVTRVSGVLAGPIVLEGVNYRQQELTVSVRQVELDWSPWALLGAEIDIASLRIRSLEISLPETQQSSDTAVAADGITVPGLPIGLRLEDALIDDIRISRGEATYRLNQVRLGLRAGDDGVELAKLDIDSDAFDASVSGELSAGANLPHDLRFSWQTSLPSGAGLSGTGRLAGNLSATRLTQQTQGALQVAQTLDLRNLLGEPTWQSKIDVTEFDSATIDPGLPALRGNLQATAEGDLNRFGVTGSMRAETPRLGFFGASFALDSLEGERRFEGLRVESLKVTALDGEISASGQLDWLPALRWDADVTTTTLNPAGLFPDWPGQINARIKTSGGMENNELVAAATVSEFRGDLRNYPLSLQGDLKWQNRGIDIGRLDFSSGDTRISARGRIAETLALTWSLDSSNLAEIYPDAEGSLKASGSLDGTREAPKIEASLSGKSLSLPGYRLGTVEGRVTLDPFELQQFDIRLVARSAMIQGQAIESIEVDANPRRIAAAIVASQASAQIELAGMADAESWRGDLVKLSIQTPDYSDWVLAAPAPIGLSRESLSASGVCLRSTRKAEICGNLQGQQQDWKIDLDVRRLPLQMLGRWTPAGLNAEGLANATARLDYRQPDRLLGKIDIELVQGSLVYSLQPQKPLRLDYQTGNFNLQLTESGVQANTQVTLVNGDRLQGTASLPGASLLAFDPDRQRLQGEIGIRLRDLGIVDALIDEIDQLYGSADVAITVSGTMRQPRLNGTARLSDASVRIPRLNLVLGKLNIDATSDASANLNYRADASIGEGRVEVSGNTVLDAARGWASEAVIDSKGIDIAGLLNPWLPPEVNIRGLFDTRATLQFRAPDQLNGEVRITANQGSLLYPLLEGEIEQLEYRDVELDMVIGDLGIRTSARAALGTDSKFNATLDLPRAKPLALDFASQNLVGNAQLDFRELAIIEALVPEIDKPRGEIALNLDIAGTLARPRIRAGVDIADAAVNIPRLGLQLEQITMRGTTDGEDRFNFVLELRSGEGQLNISGNSLLDAAGGWPTTIRVKGENFEVSRIPEAAVNVSPDLTVQLKNRSIDIQGDLLVPYARLQPRDFTTAARVSGDTVIIGGEEAPEPKWSITSRINLILGDRVTFFGYGFEGQLAGKLLITEEPGQLTSGSGEISIPEGRYRAYGQRLDIENGRVLFTGGPVTNPGLDVRATRTSNGVVAGLQLRGSLRNPQVELFSVPAMGQTDTLSYLLFGRPMETASGEDGAVMAQAALALGLSGGDRLARTIGDRFGLDEMRVESNNTGDQASLVVGRYLSPRLYVSYGVGLIESINTLNLRYQMSEKWQLEAESGAYQGADILYTIER